MNRVLRASLATATMISSCLPGMAGAQTTPPANSLDEIIVTAEKRPERLQDVPAQVDVLTAESLDAFHIRQTPDITATIPNLTIARNDTYTNSTIVLRGITQANNSDVPVAIIVDGVPQDDSKQFSNYLFDIAQSRSTEGTPRVPVWPKCGGRCHHHHNRPAHQ